LNLPYSVIRGEEFALEVTIFNYVKVATEVTYSRFVDSLHFRENRKGWGAVLGI
jgi:hypothetical protein